jgi:hypothetical protein
MVMLELPAAPGPKPQGEIWASESELERCPSLIRPAMIHAAPPGRLQALHPLPSGYLTRCAG